MVLYYPFSGDAKDESGHGNDGTVVGATITSDRSGNPDNAYAFNGNDDHILMPDIVPDSIAEFTISVWVKPAEIVTRRLCVYLGARTGEAWMEVRDSSFIFAIHPADGTEPMAKAPATAGELSHLAAVYRRGTRIELWVNGHFRSSVSIGNSPLKGGRSSHDSSIGSYAPLWLDWGRQNGIFSWLGTIDQVRIFERALGQTDIQQLTLRGL
jgi:hypothetical protein